MQYGLTLDLEVVSPMSICLNPGCQRVNAAGTIACEACGYALLIQGRYRPIRMLGEGAFGKTFKAEDEGKPSHPYCVIKQFAPHDRRTLDKSLDLFQQEAIQLEQLGQHPQIPILHWCGDQDGQHYIVQEYIDGQTLAQELAQDGPFDEGKIRVVLQELLPVLEVIHGQGIIHRDIKPENIIRRHHNQQLVLVDFGAAKVTTETNLAKTGTTIGSAEYAAPEQARGKATFASDLYALGVTCIHLLTGLSPFELYSDLEGAWVWEQYLVQRPLKPKLRRVLNRLIQSPLSQRYGTAAEVLRDVQDPVIPARSEAAPHLSPETEVRVQTLLSESRTLSRSSLTRSHDQTYAMIPQDSEALGRGDLKGADMALVTLMEGTIEALETWIVGLKPWQQKLTLAIVLLLGFGLPGLWAGWWGILVILLELYSLWAYQNFYNPWRLIRSFQTPRRQGWMAHSTGVTTIAVGGNGQTIATGSNDRHIILWDATPQKPTRHLSEHEAPITALIFSPSHNHIISASADGLIKVWPLLTSHSQFTLQGHQGSISALLFGHDSHILISASTDEHIKLWNLLTGQLIQTLDGHGADVTSLAISSHRGTQPQHLLLSGSEDETLRLWDAVTGTELKILEGHGAGVTAVAFSADGKCLASGSRDKTIKLWRTDTGQDMRTLRGHKTPITALTFNYYTGPYSNEKHHPNHAPPPAPPRAAARTSSILASGSQDGEIRLWDMAARQQMQILTGHTAAITALQMMPDGKRLVSSSLDGTVRLWRLAP